MMIARLKSRRVHSWVLFFVGWVEPSNAVQASQTLGGLASLDPPMHKKQSSA